MVSVRQRRQKAACTDGALSKQRRENNQGTKPWLNRTVLGIARDRGLWIRQAYRGFNCFKNARSGRPPQLFILFDLLWSDGRDLTGKTVLQRRKRLQDIIIPVPGIQVGNYIEDRGIDLFRLAKEKDWRVSLQNERRVGIRLADAHRDWVKIKARLQQEFVIGGLTEGKGSRKHFGALLLGAYRNSKLHYFGHSGGNCQDLPARSASGSPPGRWTLGGDVCWS